MPELEISRIHDAYAESGECPICSVMTIADTAYVRSFRGGRVMAPEVRVQTNRSGFCPSHYERLYLGEGKLGLSLMVHTHLAEVGPGLRKELEATLAAARHGPPRRGEDAVGRAVRALREQVARCFICDMLAKDLERYCFTVIYLWQRDPGFPETLRSSRGFCIPHFAALLDKAGRMLKHQELREWLEATVPLQVAGLERLTSEIFGFTQSYHHDARDGIRPDARTALSRALQKLSGRLLRLEGGAAPGPVEDQDQDRLT